MIAGTMAPILIALCSLVISTLSFLLAFQVRRDQRQARIEQRRAYITAAQSGSQRGERDVCKFLLANTGWFPARQVIGVIENDRDGELAQASTLWLAKEHQDVLRIEVPRGALDPPEPSYLTLRWSDPNGVITKERVLRIQPIG